MTFLLIDYFYKRLFDGNVLIYYVIDIYFYPQFVVDLLLNDIRNLLNTDC